jgi:carbonic anhydrase
MREIKMRYLCWLLFGLMSFQPLFAQEHSAASSHSAVVAEQGPFSAEDIWDDLMAGNRRYVSGKPMVREFVQTRHGLVNGQHPKVIVISCSDSRVSPELLFDKSLGDLFVIRTAGNIADPIALGSIEYAVDHLNSPLLVVLGHEKCGAVTAACSGEKMPTPGLQAIVDKIGPAVSQAKTYAKPGDLVAQAILENVHQSAKDILAESTIVRSALKEGKLSIIEAVYRLDSGEVVRLGKLSVLAPAYKLDIGDIVRVR